MLSCTFKDGSFVFYIDEKELSNKTYQYIWEHWIPLHESEPGNDDSPECIVDSSRASYVEEIFKASSLQECQRNLQLLLGGVPERRSISVLFARTLFNLAGLSTDQYPEWCRTLHSR